MKLWLMTGVCGLALTFAGSAYAVDITLEDLDLDDAEITDNNTAAQAQDQNQTNDNNNDQSNDNTNDNWQTQDQYAFGGLAKNYTTVVLPDEVGKKVLSISYLSATVSGSQVVQGFGQINNGEMSGADADLLDTESSPVFADVVADTPVMNNQLTIMEAFNGWSGISSAAANSGQNGVAQSNVGIAADIGSLTINP